MQSAIIVRTVEVEVVHWVIRESVIASYNDLGEGGTVAVSPFEVVS